MVKLGGFSEPVNSENFNMAQAKQLRNPIVRSLIKVASNQAGAALAVDLGCARHWYSSMI
jgi:hypothetical protein